SRVLLRLVGATGHAADHQHARAVLAAPEATACARAASYEGLRVQRHHAAGKVQIRGPAQQQVHLLLAVVRVVVLGIGVTAVRWDVRDLEAERAESERRPDADKKTA